MYCIVNLENIVTASSTTGLEGDTTAIGALMASGVGDGERPGYDIIITLVDRNDYHLCHQVS